MPLAAAVLSVVSIRTAAYGAQAGNRIRDITLTPGVETT